METKPRFYQGFGIPKRTGRGREIPGCGQFAVKNLGLSKQILEPEARLLRITLLGFSVNRGTYENS